MASVCGSMLLVVTFAVGPFSIQKMEEILYERLEFLNEKGMTGYRYLRANLHR